MTFGVRSGRKPVLFALAGLGLLLGYGCMEDGRDGRDAPPPTPALSVYDVSGYEGGASETVEFRFLVMLSVASDETVTVNCSTSDGTAQAGSDYVAASQSITFVPGQTQAYFTVTVNGDSVVEPEEYFLVTLSSPSGAVLADSDAIGRILNDDSSGSNDNQPPTITITAPEAFGDRALDFYTIRWTDSDPDSNAKILLYYDTDSTGHDGTLVVSDIDEDDEADSYRWDASGVLEGRYFIYAKITDGINPPVFDYSTSSVEITHTPPPGVIFVDSAAAGANDGSSWADAFNDLQDALALSESGDEIWVAAGIYKPTDGFDRTATFQLVPGVAVYGGFVGGEVSRSERDGEANVTILSGDIGLLGETSDNCYTVVTGASGATLDGFTITAGSADGNGVSGGSELNGGGMYNSGVSNLTIAYCTFADNMADFYGGGIYDSGVSNLTVSNCTFTGNTALTPAGSGYGAGIYSINSSPTLTNCEFKGNAANYGGGVANANSSTRMTDCVFIGNTASDKGGGILNSGDSIILTNCSFLTNKAKQGGGMYNFYNSSITITSCIFENNTAYNNGGGMHNDYSSSVIVINDVFIGNTAEDYGGGMYNVNQCSPIVMNCTFSENTANYGGGIVNLDNSSPTVTNCILWGDSAANSGEEVYNDNSTPFFSYCDISGGIAGMVNTNGASVTDGGGNIDADPMFADESDPDGPDDTLATEDDGLALTASSPCIDAGTSSGAPDGDITGTARPQDGDNSGSAEYDIGAYEFPE